MAISRRSNGTWRVETYLNGRRAYSKSGFTRKSDARKWEYEQQLKYSNGDVFVQEKYTFDDLIQLFKERHLPMVRFGTAERYEVEIRYRIEPFFKEMLLNQISSSLVEDFKSAVCKELENPKSVNNCIHTLRLMLNKAVKWEMLEKSPYKLDSMKVDKNLLYPWWDDKDDIGRFLATAEELSIHYPAFVLALETGMRVGEITGLSKQDVDFERGKICVHRQWLDKQQVYGPCKHGVKRYIDFDAKSKFAAVMREAVLKSSDPEVIFVTESGKRVNNRNLANGRFPLLVKKAGVPKICFHGLRHTFASWYMKELDNVWALKEILGHANIQTTHRYIHHSPRHSRATLNLTEKITPESRQTAQILRLNG